MRVVTVLAAQADDYHTYPSLWASLGSLVFLAARAAVYRLAWASQLLLVAVGDVYRPGRWFFRCRA